MATTQADIARLSNVSRVAVSQVLRDPNHPRFSPETRQRILDVAHNLDYVPNRLAASLREQKTGILALIMPFNVPELMDTIEKEANRLGYALLIQFTFEPDLDSEIRAVQTVLERQVDGIIWQPTAQADCYDQLCSKLVNSNTSIVLLERDLPQLPEATVVRHDRFAGANLAFTHLKEQGYENLVYISSRPNYPLRKNSTKGISQRHKDVVFFSIPEKEDTNTVLDKVLKNIRHPLGVYCDNDWMATRLFQKVEKQQMNSPQDIGIITFGDMLLGNQFRIGELTRPTITAVRCHEEKVGKKSVGHLVANLKTDDTKTNNTDTNIAYGKDIPITPTLVERKSTARLTSNKKGQL